MSSTPLPDHYKVLGVSKDAQVADIRLAYRKLVLKCHPDKVQDPALKAQKQEEFQKVQQAYELLTDEEERRKYNDQVRLADLKEQLRKTNVSTPRSSSKYAEYEIRTTEPRAASYQASTNVPPPASKGYTYSGSYEEDVAFGPRVYQPGSSRPTRRETTYVDGRSKRDGERDRDARDKDKDRDRRKKAEKEEAARRADKEAKEAKEARREKKAKEKQRDKDIKRESEEKKKHAKPTAIYVDDYSDDTPAPAPKSDKKKSSKKYDEKRDRDRSSHREEIPVVSPPVRTFPEYNTSKYVEPPRAAPEPSSSWEDTHMKLKDATSYIEAARAKEGVAAGGLKRSMTYGPRMTQPPAAPTPPPVANQPSPFAVPDDDDARRSSARPRRGSTESNRAREKYRKSSREPLAEPVAMSGSPNSRHAPHPAVSGSPPHLPRTNTMPADASYPRAVPITRSQTYNYGDGPDIRGRNRSRYQSQIGEEDGDSDELYDHRARDRRHRGSRRDQSVDQGYAETSRYPGYESGRQASYSRRAEPEPDRYAYYSSGHNDGRPPMPVRESSYSTSAGSTQFAKVKTSKNYGYDDVQYTHYHHQKPREEYTFA
ncbi:hypothetical protein Trco_008046 [Trichoderma cornu-damae]|uniref:J domain-containing protein n=1 Tax=Trichoderma cornu-damae TaxID=654480 RepID=A0A9P8QF04_9HYPO|nr:hypothetical protein Trco_008046 [Trichoderma cornu-damae]